MAERKNQSYMRETKPSQQELDQGYMACGCGSGIYLLQAGFDTKMTFCEQCGKWVASRAEFFKLDQGAEILSK